MSSSFYTSVNRYGNSLLYRGYNQAGNRIQKKIKFEPELFIPSQTETEWRGFDGKPIKPINFDSMSEAKDFLNTYKDVENHKVYGMRNYILQYIARRFPGVIKFASDFIDVNVIDIEVESSIGFPDPALAKQRVSSIACYSTREKIWRVWGLKDYDPQKSYLKERNATIIYTKCQDELALLNSFLHQWSKEDYCPDVVTGWYIRFFDIPYLVNRIKKVLGDDAVKMLSPWNMVNSRTVQFKGGKTSEAFDFVGIQILDLLDLFQKFGHSYGPQESYKLDHISNVVLGEKKISYEEAGYMFKLLSTSRGVTYNEKTPNNELPNFARWCKQRDRIEAELKLRE